VSTGLAARAPHYLGENIDAEDIDFDRQSAYIGLIVRGGIS
jgi:hypothetical protein